MARSNLKRSGPELMEFWASGGEIAPMAATLGFELSDFGDGFVELSCTPDEFHYNPAGTVHGGLAATLLDTATACAVQTRLPAGAGATTLNLSVSFFRPMTVETGTIRCVGRVVSMGRRVAVAEAEVLDESGRVMARGTATCLLVEAENE